MSYDEGVDSNGDMWSKAVVGGSLTGSDWTTTYINILGEQYKTESSADPGNGNSGSAVASETIGFDNNGRPITDTAINGTVTHTDYSPLTGLVADTWVDAAGNGVYTPGIDPKTVYSYSGATSTTTVLSTTGDSVDSVTVSNGGLNTSETDDGLTTTTQVSYPSTGGEVDTTTNPDGTQLVDTYTQGLLASAVTLGADGSTITSESYGYDALRRNNSTSDWTGKTTYTLRADGSIYSEESPDGKTTTVTGDDPATDAPTATTLPDGDEDDAEYNTLGEQTSQSGDADIAAEFDYNQTTGQLASISTFSSGELDGAGEATTGFGYSDNTGLQTSKTYDDGSQQDTVYNSAEQVTNVYDVDPAGHYTSSGVFGYNTAGEQTSAAYTDYLAGGSNVTDAISNIDDMGDAPITTETARNPEDPTGASTITTASTQAFNTNDELASDKSGPSGATTVYGYYPTSGAGGTGSGASPGAMKSVKLVASGVTLSETDYGYDPVSGRMNTITIVGQNGAANQVFNITYKPNTDLIGSVSAPGSNTSYQYDPQNGRLATLGTTGVVGNSVYNAGYTYYSDDQRDTDTVTRANADGSTDSYQTTYGYDAADELNSVESSGTGGPIGSWTYDGVGNRVGFAGGSNNLNQYANYTYNARGDCTSDGVWNYSYNAVDGLTGATAVNGSAQVTFGYDAEHRLTETDTWSPNGTGGWTLTGTTRYAWDGSDLLAEFDGNNKLLRSFAYGPTGLLGITDYTSGSAVTYVPVFDATGSVVELLDTSGNVVADYHYDAWGVRTASGPAANACPFGFAGMFQDPTTGLYYDNARWYSAPQGRFLTRDPSGESGGLNLYAYCGNDPVNETDSTGLAPDGPWTLSLSGSEPGVYLPASGGPFDFSPPSTAPDPYAALVTPEMTNWWTSAPDGPSAKQTLAIEFGRLIGAFDVAISQTENSTQGLRNLLNSPYCQEQTSWPQQIWHYATSFTTNNGRAQLADSANAQIVANQAKLAGLLKTRSALVTAFNNLGLADVDLNLDFNFGPVHLGAFGPKRGLAGAIAAAGVAAGPHYHGAPFDFGIFEAGIAVATAGDSAIISRLLSSSLPELAAAEVETAAAEDVAINLGNLACFRPDTLVACPSGPRRVETIGIGRRVSTPDDGQPGRVFDPPAYRVVNLQFVKDGQEFLMSFLRPAKLIGNLGPGDTVRLSVFELRIDGAARVLGLEPCPPIEGGPGRVVIGSFHSRTIDLYRIRVEGSPGALETTGNHAIFSEDRQDFVSANSLGKGARLRTRSGIAVVESIEKVVGKYEVFNLEIDSAHRYFVTECEILVHNAGPNGILNPQFTPDGTRVLQNLTNQVNEAFAANLNVATAVLSPGEQLAAAEYTGLAKAAYGNAIERLVAREIEADPVLDGLYRHVGGPNNPDFVGRALFQGMDFDITTPGQAAAHLARPGYGAGLNIITYQRPAAFP